VQDGENAHVHGAGDKCDCGGSESPKCDGSEGGVGDAGTEDGPEEEDGEDAVDGEVIGNERDGCKVFESNDAYAGLFDMSYPTCEEGSVEVSDHEKRM
jgi:CDGSH-type Zn-finger protein